MADIYDEAQHWETWLEYSDVTSCGWRILVCVRGWRYVP